MKILAIETSCDDTSVAILNSLKNKHQVLANVVSSQIKTHQPYGGVVPNLAAREHLKNILPVLKQALFEAKVKPQDLDLLAVTQGPGLIPCLFVGVSFAKALAYNWQKPLLGVNHMEGHVYANFIDQPQIKFPILALIVSGGHSQIVLIKNHGHYLLLGQTRDDAAGEAFDKVAKLLGLGYPGGPIISQRALAGDKTAIKLPRPMINSKDFDFSFSGLKTAVLYQKLKQKKLTTKYVNNMAASFQQAVIDVLVSKTIKAVQQYRVKNIVLAGGVAANKELRQQLDQAIQQRFNLKLIVPQFSYCTDNAAMIGAAAFYQKKPAKNNWQNIEAKANLDLF